MGFGLRSRRRNGPEVGLSLLSHLSCLLGIACLLVAIRESEVDASVIRARMKLLLEERNCPFRIARFHQTRRDPRQGFGVGLVGSSGIVVQTNDRRIIVLRVVRLYKAGTRDLVSVVLLERAPEI